MDRVRGDGFKTMFIQINSYVNGVPEGYIRHPYIEGNKRFLSLIQLIRIIDDLLDSMKFPQAFHITRSFFEDSRINNPSEQRIDEIKNEGLANFAVKVIFRQNVSWQGTVTWIEEGREESFRSVLELIFLIDSALSEANKRKGLD